MSDQQTILALASATPIDVDALEKALDSATHDERLAASRKFSPKIQRALFEATQGRNVTKEQMVPTSETLKEVIHHGTNTLPAFKSFQKRFCRPVESENGRLAVGYNETPYWKVVTPGYYVGYEDEASGEYWIDYTQLPTEKCESWPPIMSNSSRFGFVVYAGMIDKMRKVSEHVTIGRAYKKNSEMNAWFVLVRQD